MQKIKQTEIEQKWNESKYTMHQLLIKKDAATIKMMEFYKIYAKYPFNTTIKNIFESMFSNWYNEKMKESKEKR